MRAQELLPLFPWVSVRGELGREITGCASDSRSVAPGDLFLCFKGEHSDGHAYLAEALQRGAVAAAGEQELELPPEVPYFRTADSRTLAGPLASLLYGEPSKKLRCIGVTGTSGKTTTTYFLREGLQACGFAAELIGSLNPTPEYPFFTTPEAPALHKRLAQLAAGGTAILVLEVSSHAIHFQRIGGVRFAAALLTNLYRDHLELHGSEVAYAQVKLSFLQSVGAAGGTVLLNLDFPKSGFFLEGCASLARTFSLEKPDADLSAHILKESATGSLVELKLPTGSLMMPVNLPGRVNAANALGAFALIRALEMDPVAAADGIGRLREVPGRYHMRRTARGVKVLIDYAHTPIALSQVLAFARSQGRRVLLVFGCVGAGDRGKRPLMGQIAALGADRVYLTTDDPRGEDPARITADTEPGLRSAGKSPSRDYFLILDRRQAIAQALADSRPGDLVVIAGRGHETVQRFGSELVHLDDEEEVARWS
ncbi:MAG: UDP-N-acetylmuramoyl-L-alanyl-D-glutamate--2,6-diaminopimelate ligase [Coprothermobacterota bacterium]|nr:UDP-N-acetylmuramoyl-L-alanyl-D-glutamate--2,6-diaminopimelate ligase [Coprothermobacterota bacterium]